MRIATVAACMCITCSAYAAVPCQSVKDGDGHWAWREIEGRRCWYRGSPGKPKTQLFWQAAVKSASASPSASAPQPKAPASSPVLYLQVTPTIPAPGADLLRAQPMTEGVLVDTPGAVIRDAVVPEADGCCWPQLDELPFTERWSGLRR